MSDPRVSCIVPVYNGERYLAEALESILAQSHRSLEVIVVDDGSTDGTADVAAAYAGKVRYLTQQNAGPAAARNRGVAASVGEFVAFLDADDLWHPDKLALQIARFTARRDLGYCVGHVQNFWEPELQEEAKRFDGHARSHPIAGYVTGTLVARTSLFKSIGSFDPSLGHGDAAEWFLRADASGAVKEILPDVLLYRRLHPSNRSRVLGADSRGEFLRLLKRALDQRRGTSP